MSKKKSKKPLLEDPDVKRAAASTPSPKGSPPRLPASKPASNPAAIVEEKEVEDATEPQRVPAPEPSPLESCPAEEPRPLTWGDIFERHQEDEYTEYEPGSQRDGLAPLARDRDRDVEKAYWRHTKELWQVICEHGTDASAIKAEAAKAEIAEMLAQIRAEMKV